MQKSKHGSDKISLLWFVMSIHAVSQTYYVDTDTSARGDREGVAEVAASIRCCGCDYVVGRGWGLRAGGTYVIVWPNCNEELLGFLFAISSNIARTGHADRSSCNRGTMYTTHLRI